MVDDYSLVGIDMFGPGGEVQCRIDLLCLA